jgi:7,8-dihydropterin-6-yl-methyl-4-(beta-D-ribofuranosyl)aminobenzene 5'-phosphate synthase
VLVDNRADLMVKSTDLVRRFTEAPLLAEHGFAALIDLQDVGLHVLWDAGMSEVPIAENMRRLEIDPAKIDAIALSHGHGDHTAAVTDVLKAICVAPRSRKWAPEASMEDILAWVIPKRVPVVVHPAAFRERWGLGKGGTRYGPGSPPPRDEWEAAGAEIILSEDPHKLCQGCWITGTVPRVSFEGGGRSSRRIYREGTRFLPDGLEDDQAVVINVKEKGLVILSGCAHAGIVNTVRYAREISGVDNVWAILGGFHLAPASEDEIERTIDEIERFEPSLVAPSHCTGFKAIRRFAERMPQVFVHGVVGTTYLF